MATDPDGSVLYGPSERQRFCDAPECPVCGHTPPDFAEQGARVASAVCSSGVSYLRTRVENQFELTGYIILGPFAEAKPAIETERAIVEALPIMQESEAGRIAHLITVVVQEIAKEASPMFSKYRDDILLNEKLFRRVKTVYEQKDKLGLTAEQDKVLDEYYKDFVRGGAVCPLFPSFSPLLPTLPF